MRLIGLQCLCNNMQIKNENKNIKMSFSNIWTIYYTMNTDNPWIVRKSCNQIVARDDIYKTNGFVKFMPLKDLARMITKQMNHKISLNECDSSVMIDLVMIDLVMLVRNKFKVIIRKILKNHQMLQTIASRSYHHDLFDKVVFLYQDDGKSDDIPEYSLGNGWKFHLHVFRNKQVINTQESLHSHRNHFVSTCIKGRLEQEIWNDTCDEINAEEFNKYMYSPIGDDKHREFNLIDMKTKIKMSKQSEFFTDTTNLYYMHPSVIHKVTNVTGKTVTLVLNSPNVTDKTCFASEKPWYAESHVRQKFTVDEVKQCLLSLL